MRTLNWDYIAGFFDGEGNVNVPCGTSERSLQQPRVTIAQSGERGRVVLVEIAAFLQNKAGISATVRPRSLVKPHHETAWILHIGRRVDVVRFLTEMRGRVFVKKTATEDVLRYMIVFPSTQRYAQQVKRTA